MAKVTKNIVDKDLREKVFEDLMDFTSGGSDYDYTKINDRQYGVLITDLNGVQRYCRIGVIVAEEREDMTAEELMQSEIAAYNAKQAEKETKAQARAEKAKKDKERRAKEKEEKENE
jgi:DNA-directed RNA polymerase delta subunit